MVQRKTRGAPRVAIHISGTLADSEGTLFPVVVTDLSSGGFRLSCSQPLLPGEQVELRVEPDSVYQAIIEWSTRTEAGGRFLLPVVFVGDVPA